MENGKISTELKTYFIPFNKNKIWLFRSTIFIIEDRKFLNHLLNITETGNKQRSWLSCLAFFWIEKWTRGYPMLLNILYILWWKRSYTTMRKGCII